MAEVASTCINYHVYLVRSCYITQGAQPGTLWCPRGAGWVGGWRLMREGILEFWLTHVVVQEKPTQHCKAIFLQPKKFLKNGIRDNFSVLNDEERKAWVSHTRPPGDKGLQGHQSLCQEPFPCTTRCPTLRHCWGSWGCKELDMTERLN